MGVGGGGGVRVTEEWNSPHLANTGHDGQSPRPIASDSQLTSTQARDLVMSDTSPSPTACTGLASHSRYNHRTLQLLIEITALGCVGL